MNSYLKELTGYDAKLQSFDVGKGFNVDIICYQNRIEAYLTHRDYGVKEFMFGQGFFGRDKELIQFCCMALRNAPHYFNGYKEAFTDYKTLGPND